MAEHSGWWACQQARGKQRARHGAPCGGKSRVAGARNFGHPLLCVLCRESACVALSGLRPNGPLAWCRVLLLVANPGPRSSIAARIVIYKLSKSQIARSNGLRKARHLLGQALGRSSVAALQPHCMLRVGTGGRCGQRSRDSGPPRGDASQRPGGGGGTGSGQVAARRERWCRCAAAAPGCRCRPLGSAAAPAAALRLVGAGGWGWVGGWVGSGVWGASVCRVVPVPGCLC